MLTSPINLTYLLCFHSQDSLERQNFEKFEKLIEKLKLIN